MIFLEYLHIDIMLLQKILELKIEADWLILKNKILRLWEIIPSKTL